ncbi:MAG: protein arginine kinase [Kiritimatiellae bacterium]|nr:protein arginine kinase [Kiritimatiellia bacterium]
MTVDDLLASPAAWLAKGRDEGVAISSRVRLARNLADVEFPGWAGEHRCCEVWARVRPVLESVDALREPLSFEMAGLDSVDKQILRERHLISLELTGKGKGSGVVLRRDEVISVMVNEEDHLRMQTLSPGVDLEAAWQRVDALDSALESVLPYAFSPQLGYLTACPTNVGTGLRASVMLHLPGLVLMSEMDPIVKGLNKIGLAVRGLWGEGTEASGNIFQISNQTTLGETELAIISRLTKIVAEIIEHEKNARMRLLEGREKTVLDYVGRAFGVLSYAHVLSSKEALYLLSGLRLGSELGMIANLEDELINEIMLLAQPGHLQKIEKKTLTPQERDEVRAWVVRRKLKGVRISRG